jgi:hypothetical protein
MSRQRTRRVTAAKSRAGAMSPRHHAADEGRAVTAAKPPGAETLPSRHRPCPTCEQPMGPDEQVVMIPLRRSLAICCHLCAPAAQETANQELERQRAERRRRWHAQKTGECCGRCGTA